MILSWNEISLRAKKFSKSWENAKYEKGETQSFYNDFFEVFGRNRRDVAIYEKHVQKLNNKNGWIDLFWPKTLLVEQKSEGRNLKKAEEQAIDYYINIKDSEKPRYILLSDFQNFSFIDLETREEKEFKLIDLHNNIRLFGFIAGRKQQTYKDQDPVNVKAAEVISKLYHALRDSNFPEKDLEILLTRIVYCLFAEDTGIFQTDLFFNYLNNRTNVDGSDTGSKLKEIFQILNTPIDKRQKNIDEELNEFPYINGDLFAEEMNIPAFDNNMRIKLLLCADLDWAKVSPALFGSLFQTVILPEEQRQEGAHYTSEKNILKTLKPLFLDYLEEKFIKIKEDRSTQKNSRLKRFHEDLSKIKILDPACGCGNFLIVAYRELRRLEIKVMKELYDPKQPSLDVNILSIITVNQFYGIELNYFATRIAKIALWLVDHQMNMELSDLFGVHYVRIPIHDIKTILVKNSLDFDWNNLVKANECSYVIGNPPFVGSRLMKDEQKESLKKIFENTKNSGELDYVCCWFYKASNYIKNSQTKVAFVATNSISQGEQVGILWELILKNKGKIFFAHKTFKWTIDEKKVLGMDVANVLVVIIGFSNEEVKNKELFIYEDIRKDPIQIKVKNINPYLIEAPDIIVKKRSKQITSCPPMVFGSMPNEGGNLLLSDDEFNELKSKNSEANFIKFIKPFIGAKEFIKGEKRWCIWLKDIDQSLWASDKFVRERVEKVKKLRSESKRPATKKLSNTPWLFGEIRHPNDNYILIPANTSSKREYIPIGFFDKNSVAGNSCLIIPGKELSIFSILNSSLHMTWVKNICGRLKDDFRYSIEIVYNNFPFIRLDTTQKNSLIKLGEGLLDLRNKVNLPLKTIYDPLTMPIEIRKLHNELNEYVNGLYSLGKNANESEIMSKLFNLISEKKH